MVPAAAPSICPLCLFVGFLSIQVVPSNSTRCLVTFRNVISGNRKRQTFFDVFKPSFPPVRYKENDRALCGVFSWTGKFRHTQEIIWKFLRFHLMTSTCRSMLISARGSLASVCKGSSNLRERIQPTEVHLPPHSACWVCRCAAPQRLE